ncbi:MAG: MBL fold metallo-hydrolase [Oscillospiraceae bacterium]|nr:MBL fold metallo-hydrolase [Oscillospiraceae bacterium]
MLIKTLPVGHLETNCYIATDESTLKCAVIDPGAESNVILDYIESNNLAVEAIFLTHGHFDHTLALEAVMEATGAPAYINENDIDSGAQYTPYPLKDIVGLHKYKEGDAFNVGGLVFRVIETPGHSPGSVTLLCESVLFTGDTLFRGSCGRTDFAGGDMEQMMVSLKRLSDLDGDFEVYPGHADSSTLGRERTFNHYVILANGESD